LKGRLPDHHVEQGEDDMGLKEAYQEQMEAQLKEWAAKIDQVKARADVAEAGAKVEYYKQIETMRAKADAVRTQLNGMKASSEAAWESLKGGVESAWTDLKASVEGAVAKFK
jgi:multidrug resistance efflux pump